MTMTREEELERPHPHNDNGYNNYRCRGPICQEAHALATLITRQERREYTAKHGLPEHVEHGPSAYTNWGCKCDVCLAGHAEEVSRYR